MDVQYKYTTIDGEFYLPTVKKESLDDLRGGFKGRADDVTVVTYPKSGTTWMQHIVKLIRNGGIDNPKVSTIFPWMDVSDSKKMEVKTIPLLLFYTACYFFFFPHPTGSPVPSLHAKSFQIQVLPGSFGAIGIPGKVYLRSSQS